MRTTKSDFLHKGILCIKRNMAPNAIIILFSAVLFLASCGKGGDPTPPPPKQKTVAELLVLSPWKIIKTEYWVSGSASNAVWVNITPVPEIDTFNANGVLAYTYNGVAQPSVNYSLTNNNTQLLLSNANGPFANLNISSITDKSMVTTVNNADGKVIVGYYYETPTSEDAKPYYDARITYSH